MVVALERRGRRPAVMPVTDKEKNVTKLRQAYALGMAQVNAELPQWRDFLGV